MIDFPTVSFGTILAILVERYGQPTSKVASLWRSNIGAIFENVTYKWAGKRLTMELNLRKHSADRGLLEYTTKAYEKHQTGKSQEYIKERAKGL